MNTGGDCGSASHGAIDFHAWWCLRQQACPFTVQTAQKSRYCPQWDRARIQPRREAILIGWMHVTVRVPELLRRIRFTVQVEKEQIKITGSIVNGF